MKQIITNFSKYPLWLFDLVFIICISFYVFCAYQGNLEISASGAVIDSDLQTYAQDIAGKIQPELFEQDPVLNSPHAGVSIPNLQSLLGIFLLPQADDFGCYAVGLLRAGALIILLFYSSWYFFGRWFLKSPCMSAMLSLAMGITIWIGWGTFWGITHSDPVPRSLFAAVFPILLGLAIYAVINFRLRPVIMLLTGVCIWIHGISALNCGAMFFLAFMFIKPHSITWKQHFFNLLVCLTCFLLPVFIFLWPTLSSHANLADFQDNTLIKQALNYRWHEDYHDFAEKMLKFWNPLKFPCILIMLGAIAWLIDIFKTQGKKKVFCLMAPCFLLALLCVAAFCWLETNISLRFNRMPQGHELVRGMRFLAPVAWILLAVLVQLVLGKWLQRIALTIIIGLLLVFTVDKQYLAAQYYLANKFNISLPLSAQAESQKREADKIQQLMKAVAEKVPPGDIVFGLNNDMQIRYLARRPLAHIFKDGAMFFYSKDAPGLAQWLHYEKLLRQGPTGILAAWQKSGAPWLLLKEEEASPLLLDESRIVLNRDGWLLLHANFIRN